MKNEPLLCFSIFKRLVVKVSSQRCDKSGGGTTRLPGKYRTAAGSTPFIVVSPHDDKGAKSVLLGQCRESDS